MVWIAWIHLDCHGMKEKARGRVDATFVLVALDAKLHQKSKLGRQQGDPFKYYVNPLLPCYGN